MANPGNAFILALDQGTTSSRAIVFDGTGRRRGSGRRALAALYPRPGWVEQEPEAIWRTVREAAADALAAAGISPAALAAIGIANQRETTIVWDRASGRPIHNAIVWQCRRTAPLCAELRREGWAPVIARRTGLVADPYFSATKVAWILDHVAGSRERAARGELLFGTVDSWLLWRLTGGVHATDPTNAARTMLFDIYRQRWDPELLDRLAVPGAMLPEVRPTCGVFATTHRSVLGAEVPVASLVGDQQAALFGQGCWQAGAAKNTYGTGCFLLLHSGKEAAPPTGGLLTTLAAAAGPEPQYCTEGSVFTAGAAIDWLCELGVAPSPAEASRLASTVPDTAGAVFVPAFAGLGAPHWDPTARGALLGLTRAVGRAHLCRAALEGVAQRSREVFARMAASAGVVPSELRVDGGLAGSDPLLQLQSDLLGVPVLRPTELETTALGAALLAGLAVGVWPDRAGAAGALGPGRRFLPMLGAAARTARAEEWSAAVERCLGWADRTGGGGGDERAPGTD